MACGNNHVSRSTVHNIRSLAGIEPVVIKPQANAVDHQIKTDNSEHYYVDDRGNPRKGNIYPHIHHGQDFKEDRYFVQSSRAPSSRSSGHLAISYGPTAHLSDPYAAHPREERISFSGSNPPDPALLNMAIEIIGALLRGDELS
jgi:hypothetical protein